MVSHYDAADAKTKAKVQAEWSAMLDSVSDSDSDLDAEEKEMADWAPFTPWRACSVRHGHDTFQRFKADLPPGGFKSFLKSMEEQNKWSYETHHPGCSCAYFEKLEADTLRAQMDYFLQHLNKKQLTLKDIEKLLGEANYLEFVKFRTEQRNNAK